jgi:hypothetical protein
MLEDECMLPPSGSGGGGGEEKGAGGDGGQQAPDAPARTLPDVKAWLDAVKATGVASAFTLRDVEEQLDLAAEYAYRLEQWTAVVQVLEEEADRTKGQLGVSLDSVVNGFGVQFTRETTDRIFTGIFNGLSNFVACIVEACNRSRVGAHDAISRGRHTYQAEVARFEQDAALVLRDVFDTQPDLSNEAVCQRARIAVAQLYQKHAVKAIDREKAAMEVCCNHLERFKKLCAGYLPLLNACHRRPGTDTAALFFERQIIPLFHTVRAAHSAISVDPVLHSRFSAYMISDLIDAFDRKDRPGVDNWMRCYAHRVQAEIDVNVAQRTMLMRLAHTHTVWHMVAVNTLVGDASSTPLQAPGSHAPFPGRVSVVSATLSAEDSAQLLTIGAIPVVRACHVLSTLMNNGSLRMGLLNCRWVQTAAMADAARYEQSKSFIFQGTLMPLARESAIAFDHKWIEPTAMRNSFREVAKRKIHPENQAAHDSSSSSRTPNSELNMGSRLSVSGGRLAAAGAVCEKPVNPSQWATMQDAASVLNTLEPYCVIDYAVLWIVACCLTGMPPSFEAWQIPVHTIVTRMQVLVPVSMRPTTEQALNPRVAGVLKLLVTACKISSINVDYCTDQQRRRGLTFHRSVPSDNTQYRVVSLIQEILSHLKDQRTLPDGVTWHIKGRQMRRLKSKAATRLRDQYRAAGWYQGASAAEAGGGTGHTESSA